MIICVILHPHVVRCVVRSYSGFEPAPCRQSLCIDARGHGAAGCAPLLTARLRPLSGRSGYSLASACAAEWPMVLSGLKMLLETGETLTTPGSLMDLSPQQVSP